jgi:SNF2 family DNA or RNA helicase
MARPISSADAKRVINAHQSLANNLLSAIDMRNKLKDDIVHASNALVTSEILSLLRNIPIDEINREKKGFRIKALRDNGYQTIADIAPASVYTLSSIYGISDDAAYSIKRVVDKIVSTTRKGVKIKISADDKSAMTSQLVLAISRYKQSEAYIFECEKIYNNSKQNIEKYLQDLAPASSGLKWIFSSEAKKKAAIEAYNILTGMLTGGYAQATNYNVEAIHNLSYVRTDEAWQDFSENSIRFFNVLEDVAPGVLGTDDTIYGLPEELAREIQDQCYFPDGLLCELRRYQEWGVKYILHQERVLLGDEMGLGKTIQAIASMVSLKNTGATHFVVVCPASVLANWCREIRKMSKLSVVKIHGAGRKAALESWKKTGGVAVTTYETTGFFKLEDDFKFSMLVVDEAHYIKNPDAKRTKNVTNISYHAERILFMTGTALENRVEEMISLIKVLQPHIASKVHGMEFLSSAPQFREAVAPVYYRRKREDVLTELPDLIETQEWCSMNAIEEQAYEESVLGSNFMAARRVSWNVDDLKDSSKATRLMEIINEATEEGRKVIVFSFFLDTIRKITNHLGHQCYGPINGSISPQRRQEIIDEFDTAPAGSVLAAQIQAGGTGLNIQSASVVIICEPQFKPSIENQAISRAYRMGQTRNVLVYRLLCENSVDEKITDLLATKQEIFDAFADESVAANKNKELDEKVFGNIIKEEIERINAKRGNQTN